MQVFHLHVISIAQRKGKNGNNLAPVFIGNVARMKSKHIKLPLGIPVPASKFRDVFLQDW